MRESLRLEVTTAPTKLPVTMDEIRSHLRLDVDQIDQDPLLAANIRAATNVGELYTRRAFITRSLTVWLDRWPRVQKRGKDDWWDGVRQGSISDLFVNERVLELPSPPLQNIVLINTYDDADVVTVFAASKYFVDTKTNPGRIGLRDAAETPAPKRGANGW